MHASGWEHLSEIPRYLRALVRRLQKYGSNPERDLRHAAQIDAWRTRLAEARARRQKEGGDVAELDEFRWWIEELGVALFAQELKTPFAVSQKRLERRWSELGQH